MDKLFLFLISTLFCFASVFIPNAQASSNSSLVNLEKQGIHPATLRVAMRAYRWAKAHGKVRKPIMTLIDFTKPSTQKRMWVIDMQHGRVLYKGFVAHGKNSGGVYATHFSNRSGSKASELGAMITGESYYGKHGLSVKIVGLEKGINNNVYNRTLVFHSAHYATPAYIQQKGKLGRSWGCFAINPKKSNQVFRKIKNGSFVFAYAKPIQHDPHFS